MIVFDWQDDGQDDGEENPIQHLGVEMVAYLKTLQCIDVIRNFLNRGTCTCTCVLISFLSRSNKKSFSIHLHVHVFTKIYKNVFCLKQCFSVKIRSIWPQWKLRYFSLKTFLYSKMCLFHITISGYSCLIYKVNEWINLMIESNTLTL